MRGAIYAVLRAVTVHAQPGAYSAIVITIRGNMVGAYVQPWPR